MYHLVCLLWKIAICIRDTNVEEKCQNTIYIDIYT